MKENVHQCCITVDQSSAVIKAKERSLKKLLSAEMSVSKRRPLGKKNKNKKKKHANCSRLLS
jgi:hypothetical protein